MIGGSKHDRMNKIIKMPRICAGYALAVVLFFSIVSYVLHMCSRISCFRLQNQNANKMCLTHQNKHVFILFIQINVTLKYPCISLT